MATPNPYIGTSDEAFWRQGYEHGTENPTDTEPTPPSPLDPNGAQIWLEGALAGRDDHAASLTHTSASADEVPADFQVAGLPSFRYNLPSIPLATVELDTGTAHVSVALSLRGNVTVTFEDSAKGMSVDQSGYRLEASSALGPITEGVRVSGLPDNPSIGVTMGSQYDLTEVRFTPPNTMTFIGQARISYTVDTKAGAATVQGQPGVDLTVTVTPHQPPEEPVETEEQFRQTNTEVWVGIGVFALVAAIAIAAAPETGGASLVLLAE